MLTAVTLLSIFLAQHKKIIIEKEFFDELKSLPVKIDEVLHQSDVILEIARKFQDTKNFFFLGRGLNFPLSLEGALKVKETSYIHAEGYPAGEMKHGHIALIDNELVSVFIATKDHTYSKILSNMEEVHARGGQIIAIVNEADNAITNITKDTITVPLCREELMSIVSTVAIQLLAYHIANLKDIDVDKPKNLAKSVTVE